MVISCNNRALWEGRWYNTSSSCCKNIDWL